MSNIDLYDITQWVTIALLTIALSIFINYVITYARIFRKQLDKYSITCFVIVFLILVIKIVLRAIVLIGVEI